MCTTWHAPTLNLSFCTIKINIKPFSCSGEKRKIYSTWGLYRYQHVTVEWNLIRWPQGRVLGPLLIVYATQIMQALQISLICSGVSFWNIRYEKTYTNVHDANEYTDISSTCSIVYTCILFITWGMGEEKDNSSVNPCIFKLLGLYMYVPSFAFSVMGCIFYYTKRNVMSWLNYP